MNVSQIHSCYGCGLCAVVCAKKIISIQLNADGFYEPRITDESGCVDCGLCIDVCSYSDEGLSLENEPIHSFAAWSNEKAVRSRCSSGGVGFELGRTAIEQGYKVCGVRYNADLNRAEHYIATTIDELILSVGSKYIQSYTVDGFKAIRRKEKYLVTGTPCQIDSFRRYIQKFHCEDNFVLMDFFCHGVPSMLLWQKYSSLAEKQVGKITSVSWRNKLTGWHDSWAMCISGEKPGENDNAINSRLSQGDMFYRGFLSDACLGKACYEKCKFKYKGSSADIRIGDLWGETYNDNEDGVSAAIAFTEKGDKLLKQCNCTLVEHSFDVVAEGQMKTSPIVPPFSKKVFQQLRKGDSTIFQVISVMNRFERKELWTNRLRRLFRMIGIQIG